MSCADQNCSVLSTSTSINVVSLVLCTDKNSCAETPCSRKHISTQTKMIKSDLKNKQTSNPTNTNSENIVFNLI